MQTEFRAFKVSMALRKKCGFHPWLKQFLLGQHNLRLCDIDEVQVVLFDDIDPVLRRSKRQRVLQTVEPGLRYTIVRQGRRVIRAAIGVVLLNIATRVTLNFWN